MKAKPHIYQTNSMLGSSPEAQWLDAFFALHLVRADDVIGQGKPGACACGGEP
jgi:hypothetical protein